MEMQTASTNRSAKLGIGRIQVVSAREDYGEIGQTKCLQQHGGILWWFNPSCLKHKGTLQAAESSEWLRIRITEYPGIHTVRGHLHQGAAPGKITTQCSEFQPTVRQECINILKQPGDAVQLCCCFRTCLIKMEDVPIKVHCKCACDQLLQQAFSPGWILLEHLQHTACCQGSPACLGERNPDRADHHRQVSLTGGRQLTARAWSVRALKMWTRSTPVVSGWLEKATRT